MMPLPEGALFLYSQAPSQLRKLTISATLLSGGIDVYLGETSISGKPSHSPSSYTWSGRRIVLTPTMPSYCVGCSYTVGVRGTTAASFTLVYTVDEGPTFLQQGIATPFLTADSGEALYFGFTVSTPSALTITVTPTNGDPNLYISTADITQQRPDVAPMWSSTEYGQTSVIKILMSDARFQLGTYYIAVRDRDGGACTFSVLVSSDVVQLADGQPQHAALATGAWSYYTFTQPAAVDGASDVLVRVSPAFGDPNVYVNPGLNRPSLSNFDWRSAVVGSDELVLQQGDAGYCSDCTYTIGVHAIRATNFTIVVASAGSIQLLQAGVPSAGTAPRPSYFEFAVVLPAGKSPPLLQAPVRAHSSATYLTLCSPTARCLARGRAAANAVLKSACMGVLHIQSDPTQPIQPNPARPSPT